MSKNNVNMFANVSTEIDGDLIFLTCAKYKLFLTHGKRGRIAKDIYEHLMFTARLQKTNIVKATDRYICNALEIGQDAYRDAKRLLVELCLVEKIIRKDSSGKIKGHYIKVKTVATPFEKPVEPEHEKPDTGQENSPLPGKATVWLMPEVEKSGTKCFNEEVKFLNEKDKCLNEEENKCLNEKEVSADAETCPSVLQTSLEINNKTKLRKELHTRMVQFFDKAYLSAHEGEHILWNDKQIGSVACAVRYALKMDNPLFALQSRLTEFINRIRNPDNAYEASMACTPSQFVSMWNSLIKKRDYTSVREREEDKRRLDAEEKSRKENEEMQIRQEKRDEENAEKKRMKDLEIESANRFLKNIAMKANHGTQST